MIAENGTLQGVGHVIRKDGTKVEFTIQSDPLTKEQAEKLNDIIEEKDHECHSFNDHP